MSLVFTFVTWRLGSSTRLGERVTRNGIPKMSTWNDDWASEAQCKQARPDELFVRGAAQNRAKQLCGGCPVKTECLAEALDNQIEWGVWGGMTERERRAILRKRPNVVSWRRLFETAAAEQAGQTLTTSAVVSA